MKRVVLSITILLICISSFACNNNSSSENFDPENALFHDGLLGICNDSLCGYINEEFEEAIDFNYNVVYPFNEGVAVVEKGGHKGVIDTDGNELIPLDYDHIYLYPETKTIKAVDYYVDYFYGYEGEEISFTEYYTRHGYGEDDLIAFNEHMNFLYDRYNRYGFKNIDGEIVIAAKYDSVWGESFSDSIMVKIDNKYYLLDKDGNESDYLGFNLIGFTYYNGYLTDLDGTNRWGLVDTNGNSIIDNEYIFQLIFNENGYAIASKYVGKYGLIDAEGNTILKTEYSLFDEYRRFLILKEDRYAIFYNEDKYLLYNSFGEKVYQTEDIILDANDDYIILRSKDDNYQYLCDFEGNMLLGPYEYIYFDYDDRGYIYAEDLGLNGKLDIFNMRLKEISPDFDHFVYGSYVKNKSNKTFFDLINNQTSQHEVYNDDFDLIFSFDRAYDVVIYSDGYILIDYGNYISVLDHKGNHLWSTADYMFRG